MDSVRLGARKRISRSGQEGQILLMYMIFLLPMTFMVFSVYNVGMLTAEKMKVQTAADNAAYSAAVWEARYMNLSAYITRAMIANYDALATVDAMWSMADSLDGFVSMVETIVYPIPIVGEIVGPIAEAIHAFAGPLNLAMSKATLGFGKYIEVYNRMLSISQEGLYALNQLGRQNIIKTSAWGTDTFVRYNDFAEIYNSLSLNDRVTWKADSSMSWGSDNGLRLSTARSLNNFSNGGALRDGLGNLFPGGLGSGISISLIFCSIGVTIGPIGYDGEHFNHVTGNIDSCPMTTGENCNTSIVRRELIYEHDKFGIDIELCVADIGLVHHSDDGFNILWPHVADQIDGGEEHHQQNFQDCSTGTAASNPNPMANFAGPLKDCKQKREQNQQCAQTNAGKPLGQQQNCFVDESTTFDGQTVSCDDMQDKIKDQVDSFNNSNASGVGLGNCATTYKFDTALDQVQTTTYVQDPDVLNQKRIEGPMVFVYFRKQTNHLPLIQGLALTTPNDVEAYAAAKVYYTQRPGNTDTNSQTTRESLYNPFWAARLEKPQPFGSNALFH
jgi:hypothetical protein